MDSYFFQPVDLPPLPDRFTQQALHGPRTDLITTSRDRLIQDGDEFYRNARLQRWALGSELAEWLLQQGVPQFEDVSVQVIEHGDTLGPHTDKWQSCKLFYLLQSGGDSVETIWYQQRGHDLVREKFLLVEDTADLEEVHRMVIPERQWGFINVAVIHEVRGMTATRETMVASYRDYIGIESLI